MRGIPEVLAALQKKAIQAGIINPPITIMARKAGFRELVDLRKLPESFPTSAFIANRPYIGSHKDALIRFFKGYVDGVRYAKANPKQAMEIMAKYTKMTDPEATAEDYKIYSPHWVVPPFVSEEAIQTALSNSPNPRAGQFKPKDFIDNDVIQQIADTGFFK
jgi:ABC-type nitrate/sulfonate/bicarbonate transport system substrate-binding protein